MGEQTATQTSKDQNTGRSEKRSQASVRHSAGSGPHADVLDLQHAAGNRVVSQLVQSSHTASRGNDVPPIVRSVLNSSGQPLAPGTRAYMEPRFGHDFSQVQVHTDTRAEKSARAVDAQAFTVGRHVVFASGKYAPHTPDGKQLLAHELAHTLQQRNAPAAAVSTPLRVTAPNDSHETEADRIARSVSRDVAPERSASGDRAAPVSMAPTGVQIARQPEEPSSVTAVGGTPQQRLIEAQELLRKTDEGQAALNWLAGYRTPVGGLGSRKEAAEVKIELTSGGRSFYDFKEGKIVLNDADSAQEMALSLIDLETRTVGRPDPLKVSRSDYVDRMVDQVTEGAVRRIELKRKLQAAGVTMTATVPLETEYTIAYNVTYAKTLPQDLRRTWRDISPDARSQAQTAGRQAVYEAIKSGKTVTGGTRQQYADSFGKAFDQAQAEEAQWQKELVERSRIEAERQAKTEAGRKALVELVNVVDPNSPQADSVIQLVYLFTVQRGGAQTMFLTGEAREGLGRLLGRYGFRDFEDVGSLELERARLEYALFNFLGLTQPQRDRLRNPTFADLYENRNWQAITYEEMQARENQRVNLRLPDGINFQGTRAAYREASRRNIVNHALAQLNQIRSAGPLSLIGRIGWGEKGAAIGGLFDAVLPVAPMMKARQAVSTQMSKMSGGGHSVGRTPHESLVNRASPPARTPVPTPDWRGRPPAPPVAPPAVTGGTVVKPAPAPTIAQVKPPAKVSEPPKPPQVSTTLPKAVEPAAPVPARPSAPSRSQSGLSWPPTPLSRNVAAPSVRSKGGTRFGISRGKKKLVPVAPAGKVTPPTTAPRVTPPAAPAPAATPAPRATPAPPVVSKASGFKLTTAAPVKLKPNQIKNALNNWRLWQDMAAMPYVRNTIAPGLKKGMELNTDTAIEHGKLKKVPEGYFINPKLTNAQQTEVVMVEATTNPTFFATNTRGNRYDTGQHKIEQIPNTLRIAANKWPNAKIRYVIIVPVPPGDTTRKFLANEVLNPRINPTKGALGFDPTRITIEWVFLPLEPVP